MGTRSTLLVAISFSISTWILLLLSFNLETGVVGSDSQFRVSSLFPLKVDYWLGSDFTKQTHLYLCSERGGSRCSLGKVRNRIRGIGLTTE